MLKKTKIICTQGPATEKPGVVDALIRYSRFPVPHALLVDVAETMDRYGRLRLLKQVTNTPGHHLPVSAFDKTVTFAMWLRQHIGDSARQTRFFGNKQPHRVNGSQPWRDRHELPLTHQSR